MQSRGSGSFPSVRGETTPSLVHTLGDELVIDLTTEPASLIFRERRLHLVETPPGRRSRATVRAFDIVGSLVLLVLIAPILIALVIAVRVTSPGPAIYASRRVAKNGSTFSAYKFRSMVLDAEDQIDQYLAENVDARLEYERHHKLRHDPRLTPIGSFIRRSSLDELPQLLNVLKGEMSLVGPRPKLPNEPERFGPTMATVLRVKPGLTGLWQVSGRSDLSFDERIALDVEYATRRTLPRDVVICLRTALQAVRPSKNGAY